MALAEAVLRRNLWIYGVGGLSFPGHKIIDMILVALKLVCVEEPRWLPFCDRP